MKRTRTNAKLLALILALVFAFELLPKEVLDGLYSVLDLHLCRRGD